MSIIIPANTLAAGGYEVENSLRFNKGSSDFLNRTFGTSTGEGTWTYSVWLKISDPSFIDNHVFFSGGGASDNRTQLYFGETTGTLNIYRSISSSTVNLESDAGFRDPSAWYNLCVQNNAGTVAAYMNGVAVTLDGTSLGTNVINKSDTVHKIGRGATGTYTSSYMSEIVFIDGTVVAPTSFGEFDGDSGIWKPIKISGLTFGDNGFYLEFKQVGTSQNSSGLGADTSGNDNHFAVNNLTAADQTTDTCTNNFATLNPLGFGGTTPTFSQGNLNASTGSGASLYSVPTIGVSSGKWYVEGEIEASTAENGTYYHDFGFADRSNNNTTSIAGSVFSRVFWLSSWDAKINYRTGGSTTAGLVTGVTTHTPGDFFQLYLDMDNELMYWGKDGALLNSTGVSFNGKESPTGEYFFAFGDQYTNGTTEYAVNFGQGSIDGAAVAAHNDANGFGNFKYNPSVTTDEGDKDFLALCTKNLAENG